MYVLCMKQRTTLQLEHKTLDKLRKLKIYPRETYDEMINRLIRTKPTFGLKKPRTSS